MGHSSICRSQWGLKLKHCACTKFPAALYLSMVPVIKHGGQHLTVLIVIRKRVFVAIPKCNAIFTLLTH